MGVVAAKLDALRIMRVTGDIPQNVNFAVSLSVLSAFLAEHGVKAKLASAVAEVRPADIGVRAKRFTFLIECTRAASPPEVARVPDISHFDSIPKLTPHQDPIQIDVEADLLAVGGSRGRAGRDRIRATAPFSLHVVPWWKLQYVGAIERAPASTFLSTLLSGSIALVG